MQFGKVLEISIILSFIYSFSQCRKKKNIYIFSQLNVRVCYHNGQLFFPVKNNNITNINEIN